MTNDRELLEAAAKAAGMTGMKWTGSSLGKMIDPTRPDETGTVGPNWNPLADDADALRLAVKLRLDVSVWADGTGVSAAPEGSGEKGPRWHYEDEHNHGGDVCAAARRVIVRAAAALAPTP